MAFSKIKKIIGDDEDNTTDNNNEYYSKEGFKDVANGSKMILMEPRAYSESQQITDYLKIRNTVVVNLKRVTPDVAKRIVDFLSGTTYALGGDLQKLGNGIFLCTPNNVNIEGKISNDDSKKENKANSSEYDW